jgi:hypothetical protein
VGGRASADMAATCVLARSEDCCWLGFARSRPVAAWVFPAGGSVGTNQEEPVASRKGRAGD